MQDVPQKQLLNHQVSVVAISHDGQAGFPLDRRDDKSCKPRVTSAVHDEVAVLRVSYLPAQRLRNRVIDFCLRPEHFRNALLTESKGIASFWLDDFDEKLRVIRRRRLQAACRAIPRGSCSSHL